jgi:hypothetical protein
MGRPACQRQDAIGQAHDHLHVVLDHHDGEPQLLELEHEFDQSGDGGLVDAAGHFVHKDQPRAHGKSAREFEPLALSGGEFAREVIALLQQVHEGKRLQRSVARGFHIRRVGERPDDDVFRDRQVEKGFQLLEGAGDTQAADAIGPQAGDVVAVQQDATSVGRLETGDQIEQRRFASAVRTNDAHDLALGHIEDSIRVGGQPAVALRQTFHDEQRAHGIPVRRRMRSSNRLRIPLGRHMHTSRIKMP